jgi:hypothetical protein
LTLGIELDKEQLAAALPIALLRLPIHGALESGGVEDGATGENWVTSTA